MILVWGDCLKADGVQSSFTILTTYHFVQHNAFMYICLIIAYSLYYPLRRGYASCSFGLCYVVMLCNSITFPSSETSLIVSAWQPTKSAKFSLLSPSL